jgi:type II secretory pathway component PulM
MMEARSRKHLLWTIAFALIAVYFNPIFPVDSSRVAELTIVLTCMVVFAASLRYLKPVPRMSLATITDLPARGESL